MELEDLGLVASTSLEPVEVLVKPLPITKPPLPHYILDIAKWQNKVKEEQKWKEEEQKREAEEQKCKEEEERAEILAAEKELREIILSRMRFMRKIGHPVIVTRRKFPLPRGWDVRDSLNPKSNCEELVFGSGPADKKFLLEKEQELWNAAMEYRKVENMVCEYDLIPSKMTVFPILRTKCAWYHCNLVGCKREASLEGLQQYFFLEVNMKTHTVTACIALDDDVENTCNACPSRSGILHPRKGGFTCGSKEGPSKEDFGATPARALGRDVASCGPSAPLPTLWNETIGLITGRLSALVGGGTSLSGPPATAAIGTPPKSKSLTAIPNERPGPITKRQLALALALLEVELPHTNHLKTTPNASSRKK